MADRGRKAFPVSSHLCDERWQRHCMELHKQRLADMKHRIDNTKPETFDIVLSKGKRHMLEKERQTEVDRENAILLQKMVRIKEQDTRAVFRPWTARSTFQWKVGHYYDPATNTKTLDHINLTSSVSPRSIHYFALTRPGTAPPDVTARLRDMEIQVDNTKLLRAITTMRTHYRNEEFERRHAEESILVSRISNYRGPEHAKYQPPGRSISASRGSPYLAPLPGRASSSNRQPRQPSPRAGWPATNPPVSQQQYYEEAQNRDIPLRGGARGNSRPGTAIGGTQEGLGETSPRDSGSSRQSASSRQSTSSRHSGGSLNGSDRPQAQPSSSAGSSQQAPSHASSEAGGSRPGSAAAGPSFSFAGKQQEQQRKASTSSEGRQSFASTSSASGFKRSAAGRRAVADAGTRGEDYTDEQYEQDDTPYEEEEEEGRREEEEEKAEAEQADKRGSDRYESSRSSSAHEGQGDGDAEEAGNSGGYDDDGFAADGEAQESAAEDRDGERASEEDDERPAAASPDAEDQKYEEEEDAYEKEEEPYEDAATDDGDEEAAAFDLTEADFRAEVKAAEEQEMNQQFAAEMAADTYGNGGADFGNGSPYTPKVGGFAADWD